MKQYVALDKRSKKAQREYYSKQRSTWGDVNPVTRSMPNGKAYDRRKDKQEIRKIARAEAGIGYKIFFYFCFLNMILLKARLSSFA